MYRHSLRAANLTVKSEKLARAATQLEYKDIKEKFARIFGDPGELYEKDKAPDVKEEALFGQLEFGKKKWRSGMNRGRGDGGWKQGSSRGTRSQIGNNGGNGAGGSRCRVEEEVILVEGGLNVLGVIVKIIL